MATSDSALSIGNSGWFGWSGSLNGVIELASEFGVNAEPVLQALGLEEAVRHPTGCAVPTERIMRAYRELARLTGMESFPVRLAGRQTIDMLGSLADRVVEQPTLGLALSETARLQHWRGTGFLLLFEQGDDAAVLRLHTLLPDAEMARVQQDYLVAFTVSMIRSLLGGDWAPDAVHLARPRPAAAIDTSTWLTQMGCSVRFDAEEYAIVFDRAQVEASISNSQAPKRMARSLEPHMMIGCAELVDREIIRQFSVGRVSLPGVAAAMGVSVRQLQRQLESSGTSYQARLDAIRAERARRCLLNNRFSMTELSIILGFSDSAIFTRRFRSWFGVSPREWKRAAYASGENPN